MRFKYGIITFSIIVLIFILAGCGKGQPNKEGNSLNSQSSASINAEKPSSNSETSIPSNPTSILKEDESSFTSIHMVDAITGWASTKESILRTVDGGENWTDVKPKNVSGQINGPMFCQDDQTAWIAYTQESSREIIVNRTTDGGQMWESAEINTTPQQAARVSVSFLDSKYGWLIAGYGVSMGSESMDIFQTNDGGTSWKLTATTNPNQELTNELPSSGDKTGLVFADRKNGWLTGFTHGNGIWLYSTHDGGQTWESQSIPIPKGYHTEGGSVSTEPPYFFGPKEGLLPVEFRGQTPPTLVFYRTQDGGLNWNPTTPVQSSQQSFRGLKWSIIDAMHDFVSDGYKLYYTSDGTHSFTSITPNIDLNNLKQLDFVSEQLGWAIIDGGLWKTNDGGHIWTEVKVGYEKKISVRFRIFSSDYYSHRYYGYKV